MLKMVALLALFSKPQALVLVATERNHHRLELYGILRQWLHPEYTFIAGRDAKVDTHGLGAECRDPSLEKHMEAAHKISSGVADLLALIDDDIRHGIGDLGALLAYRSFV